MVAGFCNSGYSFSQIQWPVKKTLSLWREKALALKVLRQAGTGSQHKKHLEQKAKPKWKELLPWSSRGPLLYRCLNWAETDESFMGNPLPCRYPRQDSAAWLNYYSKGHSICDRHLTIRVLSSHETDWQNFLSFFFFFFANYNRKLIRKSTGMERVWVLCGSSRSSIITS